MMKHHKFQARLTEDEEDEEEHDDFEEASIGVITL